MTIVYRLMVLIAGLFVMSIVLLTIWGANPSVHIGIEPDRNENDRIRLDHGLVVLEQYHLLEAPPPTELSLRLWVQQLPSYYPFLTVRGSIGERSIGPIDVTLPPPDGKFHMIELPWWRVPVDAEHVYLRVRGHGVLVSTTAPNAMQPGLDVNGVARPELSLALQTVKREAPLEHYFPLLRIAEGKPWLLGYPQLLLVLGAAFFATWGILLGMAPRLFHDVLQSHAAARAKDVPR